MNAAYLYVVHICFRTRDGWYDYERSLQPERAVKDIFTRSSREGATYAQIIKPSLEMLHFYRPHVTAFALCQPVS